MNNLICEATKTSTNSTYVEAFIAFFVIMTIIGFVLIMVDKKRWKAHVERSNEMISARTRKVIETETVEGETEPNEDGKKAKKKKKAKLNEQKYEYEGRIKDRVLIPLAIFFGGIGELLGMIIFRHKWYSPIYKIAMPIIAAINFAFMVIITFAFLGITDSGIFFTT